MFSHMDLKLTILFIGFVFGNFVTAFFVSKLYTDKKPTEFGSKNAGTANVGAVLGKQAGFLVSLGDVLKTVIAIVLSWYLFPEIPQPLTTLYAGIGLVVAHNFPFWQNFKGGKGVAVTGIVAILYNWQVAIPVLLVALVIMIITKNLTIPPLFAITGITIVSFIVNHNFEAFILMAILSALMYNRFWSDIQDIIHGRAKEVDVLKSVKQKYQKK
ncbi:MULTISPECIES: glycerol-3-phosphate acyltransferase [Holzapfeliella]